MVNSITPSTETGFLSPVATDTPQADGTGTGWRVPANSRPLNSNSPTDGQRHHPEGGAEPSAKALEELNRQLQAWSTGMRFDFDTDAQRVVVSIIDNASGEVLRTVPSDAVIQIAKMIVQLQGNGIRTQA